MYYCFKKEARPVPLILVDLAKESSVGNPVHGAGCEIGRNSVEVLLVGRVRA
jgi:hypothetical protein